MPRGRRATTGPDGAPPEPGAGRFYMISVVSKAYGIHPQTLRLYEREGLLKPSRTDGNTRLYSDDDLRQLEVILNLTRDLGVNLAGVAPGAGPGRPGRLAGAPPAGARPAPPDAPRPRGRPRHRRSPPAGFRAPRVGGL
jgi:hypothetical protein